MENAYMSNTIKNEHAPNRIQPSDTLLTFDTVHQRVKLSRTTIWRYERAGRFPQRIYIGARSPRWIEREINDWIMSLSSDCEAIRAA